MMSCIITIT